MYTKLHNIILWLGIAFLSSSYAVEILQPGAPSQIPGNSNLPDKEIDTSNITLCNNLKDQMLAQPNHVHAQIRIDTAYGKNCDKLDPLFWQAYWPTSIQSDANKKAEACKALAPTDAVYIKYRCDINENSQLSIKDIQICERLKSQLQSQTVQHRNSKIDYAKNLKCHMIDQNFWASFYSP